MSVYLSVTKFKADPEPSGTLTNDDIFKSVRTNIEFHIGIFNSLLYQEKVQSSLKTPETIASFQNGHQVNVDYLHFF